VFWYKHLNPKRATNDHTLVFAPTCDDLRGNGLSFSQLSIKELSTSSLSANSNTATPVEGMAGESCMERVEKAIRATPGVVSASVNLATKRAEVVFSGVPDIAAVIAAIGVAGYECAVENADSRNVP
jgi:copper chaperone CopZ